MGNHSDRVIVLDELIRTAPACGLVPFIIFHLLGEHTPPSPSLELPLSTSTRLVS